MARFLSQHLPFAANISGSAGHAFWVVAFVILAALTIAFLVWRRRHRAYQPFDLATETVTIGPWTWRYHTSGRGPDLLLCHGIGANLYCWQSLVPLLRKRFRVWAVDLPGFGGSSKLPNVHYGLDDQVERLNHFMDRMNIQRAFVVGNSMGGNIALWLAREHPTRVSGIAVIAPATSPGLVPLSLRHWTWLATPASLLMNRAVLRWSHHRTVTYKDRVHPTRIEESFKTYSRQPSAVRAFMRATEAIRDPRLPSALKAIRGKVLLLWGSADLLVSKKVMTDLESALQASESHFHEGGGHHLQEDDPDWVGGKIVEFFARSST